MSPEGWGMANRLRASAPACTNRMRAGESRSPIVRDRLNRGLAHMSNSTYLPRSDRRPLVWLAGEIKTPPFSLTARRDAGLLLRALQRGRALGMPHARPMPTLGARCHELRINDEGRAWRVLYRVDPDAVLILGLFQKRTRKTPHREIDAARRLMGLYDRVVGDP